MRAFIHIEAVAARKMPEGWRWYIANRIGEDIVLVGGIPTGFITRGPRKGKPKFDRKRKMSVVVSRSEIEAEESNYESETGKCHSCAGTGMVFSSWSRDAGRKEKKCGRCKGSGATKEGQKT